LVDGFIHQVEIFDFKRIELKSGRFSQGIDLKAEKSFQGAIRETDIIAVHEIAGMIGYVDHNALFAPLGAWDGNENLISNLKLRNATERSGTQHIRTVANIMPPE
jgi:hypothetical protein